ncbi:MAG: hypothetical protein H0U27_04970 [Nitrosopumilus sp.]|nr:hypothetical protein [Nitrosopumilus sp.]
MKETFTHLEFFIRHIPITLKHYNKKDVNSVQFFALGLLKRLLHSSKSLKLILENIPSNPDLDFTAGLTIRAMILDMLIGLNFFKLLKDNLAKKLSDENMMELAITFCDTILADGLENTITYLELSQSYGIINIRQLKEKYNNVARNYAKFLEPHSQNGVKPKVKFTRAPGTKTLFKEIAADAEMNNISRIYDLYLFYSKYDHFGILYFDVENFPLSEKIKRIEKAVRLFINHCANLFDILERVSQKDTFVFSQYKIANDYLLKKNSN